MSGKCEICGKPTKKTQTGYRKTCGDKCLSELRSKKSSETVKKLGITTFNGWSSRK